MALVMTAVQQGAIVANHVEVTELHKTTPSDSTPGILYGARVKDNITGEVFNLRAKVNEDPFLFGIWTDVYLGYYQRYRSLH